MLYDFPALVRPHAPPPAPDHPIIPSGMTHVERPRKLVGSRIQRDVLPFSESQMCNKQQMLMDAALFHGRSFRVGWGPGMTMAHPGTAISSQVQGKHSHLG